eukprot:TRINITY_DN14235_c0_g1_i2.p1 TRINITY_DN14235_c0_g1~~TRINITY_DN14235_c0_g1_i2.p1  ORF type:complete len:265 (+),score=47.28 TRINITY_DN14235_c0_g1_i2:119-796(+)
MWVETQDGTALKWHYPIGVLFDLFGEHSALPWRLTARFSRPPPELLKCQSIEIVNSYFMNSLKESEYLKHGSTKKINMLSKSDQSKLWESLLTEDFEGFWRVNQSLLCDSSVAVRFIPVRVYLPGSPFVQEPVMPITDRGDPTTVRQCLADIFPGFFGSASADSALPQSPTLQQKNVAGGLGVPRVFVQGVEIDLDLPVAWLSENLAHPDNFLHIVLRPQQLESL